MFSSFYESSKEKEKTSASSSTLQDTASSSLPPPPPTAPPVPSPTAERRVRWVPTEDTGTSSMVEMPGVGFNPAHDYNHGSSEYEMENTDTEDFSTTGGGRSIPNAASDTTTFSTLQQRMIARSGSSTGARRGGDVMGEESLSATGGVLSPVALRKSGSLRSEDEFGFIDFHKLCCAPQEGHSDPLWWKVRLALADLEAEGTAKLVLESTQGVLGNIPLHLVCFRNPPADVVERMITIVPESVWMPDKDSDLAIHYACRNAGSVAVVKLLAEAFPESIEFRGENGDTPLNCALHGADEALPPPALIHLLATPHTLSMPDSAGQTPLEIFCRHSFLFWMSKEHEKTVNTAPVTHQDRVKAILDAFLDRGPPSAVMLSALRSAPTWLLNHALRHPHVRSVINDQMGGVFPCATLIIDLLAHMALVVCYTHAVERKYNRALQGGQSVGGWETWGLEAAIGWIVLRAILKLCAVSSWNLTSRWCADVWNWFDAVSVALIVITTRFVTGTKFVVFVTDDATLAWGNDVVRILVTVTAGLVWIKMVSFLRYIRLSFSYFVDGIITVSSRLLPFIISSFMILGAFASMYYIDAFHTTKSPDDTSVSNNDELNFATLPGAFVKVYAMTVNGYIHDSEFSLKNTSTMAISIVFAFTVIILLLNIFIAVIVFQYQSIAWEEEHSSFWVNRFISIVEADMIKTLCCCCKLPPGEEGVTLSGGVQFGIEWVWSKAMVLLQSSHHDPWDEEKTSQSALGAVGFTVAKILLAFVVVILKFILVILLAVWVVIGAFTAGILWPRQVRTLFLCSQQTATKPSPLSKEKEPKGDMSVSAEPLHDFTDAQKAFLEMSQNEMEARSNKRMDDMIDKIDKLCDALLAVKNSSMASGGVGPPNLQTDSMMQSDSVGFCGSGP